MNMYRWKVWFAGRADPVEVVTEQRIELHAIATALDMIKADCKRHMQTTRVQLVDNEE